MSTIDKTEMGEWLCAYLDGALSGDERALVEQLLSENAEARALLDVLRDTSMAVRELPRHPAPETILEDIRSHLERGELIGDEPEAAPRSARGSSAFSRWAIAAMLGFAAVGGIWAVVDRFGPNRTTQVASAPDVREAFNRIEEIASKSTTEDAAPANLAGKTEPRHKERSEKPRERASEKRRARRRPSTEDQPTLAGSKKEPAPAEPRPSPSHPVSVASTAPLQPIDAPLLERLIRRDRKLGQAWPTSAIRRHRFENEPVCLSFDSPDEFARNILARSLIRHLKAGAAIELKERRRHTTTSPFYLEGVAGVNFDSKKTRQILVRLPKSRVSQVLGSLLGDTSRPYSRVKLKVDSFSVDGREGVATLLGSLAPKPITPEVETRVAAASTRPAPSERKAGDDSKAPVGGMFAGLFRVIGIDPSMLSPEARPRLKRDEPSAASTLTLADASPSHDTSRPNDALSPDKGSAQAQDASPSVVANESIATAARVEQAPQSREQSKRKSLVEKRLDALRRPAFAKDADKKVASPVEPTLASQKEIAERKPKPADAPQEWITIIVELNLPETHPPKPKPPKLDPPANAGNAGPVAPKPGVQNKPSSGATLKK